MLGKAADVLPTVLLSGQSHGASKAAAAGGNPSCVLCTYVLAGEGLTWAANNVAYAAFRKTHGSQEDSGKRYLSGHAQDAKNGFVPAKTLGPATSHDHVRVEIKREVREERNTAFCLLGGKGPDQARRGRWNQRPGESYTRGGAQRKIYPAGCARELSRVQAVGLSPLLSWSYLGLPPRALTQADVTRENK